MKESRSLESRNAERVTASAAHVQALCGLLSDTGGDLRVMVRTGSMAPHIPAGSHVTIKCVPTLIKPGAVVAYLSGPCLVVHRLLRVESSLGLAFCRGDANKYDDPPVPLELLVGPIVKVEPPTGWFRLKLIWWSMARQLRLLVGRPV